MAAIWLKIVVNKVDVRDIQRQALDHSSTVRRSLQQQKYVTRHKAEGKMD